MRVLGFPNHKSFWVVVDLGEGAAPTQTIYESNTKDIADDPNKDKVVALSDTLARAHKFAQKTLGITFDITEVGG
jgi:hypothetical protein